MNKLLSILFLVLITVPAWSQKEFQINGLARGYFFANDLDIADDLDSISTRKSNYGHTLADLGISVFPNDNTEIIGMFRIRNELGGFWGGGVSFDVRQLTLKGVAGKVVRYEIGDIDLKMTPYTLWNTEEEGIVNEADVFAIRRDVVHYDMFYTNIFNNDSNTWRMQGAKVNFGLNFNRGIKDIDVNAFLTRQRAAEVDSPERLYGGGSILLNQSENLAFVFNSVNMFDLRETIPDSIQFKNSVHSLELKYNRKLNEKVKIGFNMEGGNSNAQYINYQDERAPEEQDEWFYDASVFAVLDNKTTVSLGYKDIGADFLSPGAQTKRINFDRFPSVYQQFTNDAIGRPLSYSDVISGNAETSFRLSEQLMAYHAGYNNISPYGLATPNRSGAYMSINRNDSLNFKKSFLRVAYMTQSRGTGTEEMKNFILVELGSDVILSDFLSWARQFKIDLGIRYESTSRNGEEFETVDLNSMLIDAGLTLEFADQLDLMLGAKLWHVEGNELINVRNRFNTIEDFENIAYDFNENVVAGGIRYRFNENNSLSGQYQLFDIKHQQEGMVDYGINQFTILFSLKF